MVVNQVFDSVYGLTLALMGLGLDRVQGSLCPSGRFYNILVHSVIDT